MMGRIAGMIAYELVLEAGIASAAVATAGAASTLTAARLALIVNKLKKLGPMGDKVGDLLKPNGPLAQKLGELFSQLKKGGKIEGGVAPSSVGRTWTWGFGKIGDEAAEGAYKAIRESTTDVAAISRYTKLKPERLEKIKQYLFNNKEWTGADGEIAAAWHRLRTGRGTSTDMLLLKHETAEMWLRRVKGMSYSEAHRLANERYNWQKIIEGTP